MDDLFFFALLFFAIVGLIYMVFTRQGRGAMFGGEIMASYEPVRAKRGISSCSVLVHAIDDADSDRLVGLELRMFNFASYRMIPMSIPEKEARELAELIVSACDYGQPG